MHVYSTKHKPVILKDDGTTGQTTGQLER